MNIICKPSGRYLNGVQSKFEARRQLFSSRVHNQSLRSTSPSERGLQIFSMLDHCFQEATDDKIELVDDQLELTNVLPVQNLYFYRSGNPFLNTYIRQLLRWSIFGCFATSKLGEKRNSHGVGKNVNQQMASEHLKIVKLITPGQKLYHRISISS